MPRRVPICAPSKLSREPGCVLAEHGDLVARPERVLGNRGGAVGVDDAGWVHEDVATDCDPRTVQRAGHGERGGKEKRRPGHGVSPHAQILVAPAPSMRRLNLLGLPHDARSILVKQFGSLSGRSRFLPWPSQS